MPPNQMVQSMKWKLYRPPLLVLSSPLYYTLLLQDMPQAWIKGRYFSFVSWLAVNSTKNVLSAVFWSPKSMTASWNAWDKSCNAPVPTVWAVLDGFGLKDRSSIIRQHLPVCFWTLNKEAAIYWQNSQAWLYRFWAPCSQGKNEYLV